MKTIYFVFLIMILVPLVSSVDIIVKDSFDQDETFMAKTSGSFFSPVSKDNVIFYKGHVRTSVVTSVEKIDSDFYIYGQLIDKTPGNYSIVIENAKYFNGSKIETSNIEKNFTILENLADFSIDKAAISTNKSFFIQVKNLKDTEIKITVEEAESSDSSNDGNGGFFDSFFGSSNSLNTVSSDSSSITLKAGETKKVNFDIQTNEPLLYYVTFSSDNTNYEIPVYVFSTGSKEKNVLLRFEPPELEISLATDSEAGGVFYLVNKGEDDAEEVFFIISDELEPYVLLPLDSVDSISGNFSKRIEFTVKSDSQERIVEGNIATIYGGNKTQIIIPIKLNFVKDYVPIDGNKNPISETCEQLKGDICSASEECLGNVEYASDGICCMTECKLIEKSYSGKVIGWFILIVLILAVLWFYLKRYKKVESVSDLMKVLGR